MKKTLSKSIGLLFAMSSLTLSLHAVTVKVGATQEFTTILAAYNSLTSITEPVVIELQADYNSAGETYPIELGDLTSKGASSENTITIRPASGAKIRMAYPDQSKEFENVELVADTKTITLPSLDGINVGDYVGAYGINNLCKISAIDEGAKSVTLQVSIGGEPKFTSQAATTVLVSKAVTMTNAIPGSKVFFFNGAQYVIIDGVSRTGDTGLTIANPNYLVAQVIYINNSKYITIRNCTIEGCSQSGNASNDGKQGIVYFNGNCTGATIEKNNIGDIDGKIMPSAFFLFYCNTDDPSADANKMVTIRDNNIYNYNRTQNVIANANTGVFVYPSNVSANSRIINNSFFWSKPLMGSTPGFNIIGFGGNATPKYLQFEDNKIGGTNENNEGVAEFDFMLTSGATINMVGVIAPSTLKNNVFKNMKFTSTGNNFTLNAFNISSGQAANVKHGEDAWSSNTVDNIAIHTTNYSPNFSGIVIGSANNAAVGVKNINNNTISNISLTGAPGIVPIMRGITVTGAAVPNVLWNYSGNKFSNMSVGIDEGTGQVKAFALDLQCANIGTVEKNLICNIVAKGSATSEIRGIRVYALNNNVVLRNNMIELGNNSSKDINIYGIDQQVNGDVEGSAQIYHNTVFIGGKAPDNATKSTYAYITTSTKTADVRNNIFVNTRTGGTGYHFALSVPLNTRALNLDYNLYHTVTKLASAGGMDCTNLSELQEELNKDAHSVSGDPSFVDPMAQIPDLRINTNSVLVDGKGDNTVDVAEDFYGNSRAGLTPSDLGAYAYTYGTSIEELNKQETNIYSHDKTIIVNGHLGKQMKVCDLNGCVLYDVNVNNDHFELNIEAGIYVVQVGESRACVIVR